MTARSDSCEDIIQLLLKLRAERVILQLDNQRLREENVNLKSRFELLQKHDNEIMSKLNLISTELVRSFDAYDSLLSELNRLKLELTYG
jgi:hypothetical protein